MRNAVFCFIRNEENILLAKRKKQPFEGKYAPIGGKVEEKETITSAIIREVLEETGQQIVNPIYSGFVTESGFDGYDWCTFVFQVEVNWFEPIQTEEGDLFWVPCSQLPLIDMPTVDKVIWPYIYNSEQFGLELQYDSNFNLLKIHNLLSSNP